MITQIKYPSRVKGLLMAALFSVLAHAVILLAIRIAPIVRIAMGFRGLEYVEEEYNRAILIDFSKRPKRLEYPPGYPGFKKPQKITSLDDIKKEEARRARLEARRKRERESQQAWVKLRRQAQRADAGRDRRDQSLDRPDGHDQPDRATRQRQRETFK